MVSLLSLFFSALALTSARVPPWLDRGFVALLQSPWKLVPLVLVNWLLNVSSFAIAPPVAPMRMWPDVQSFTVYGLFFLFGWMLYRHRTFLTRLVERPQLTLVVAIPIFFRGPWQLCRPSWTFPTAALALGQLSSALVGWLLFLGSITLATRRTVPASPVAMYLARASYWIYLAHLPLVAWLAVALRDVQWPSLIKGPLVMGTVLGLLLLSYELFVRRTVIGAALNGRARKTDIARDS